MSAQAPLPDDLWAKIPPDAQAAILALVTRSSSGSRALRAGGSSLGDVVKVTIFLTDMGHLGEVIELRRRYFTPPYPADSLVEVKGLYAPEAMIEIEAVAVVTNSAQP